MVPFQGYGRLTRSSTLALLTTVVVLIAEWTQLISAGAMTALRTGCQVYVLLRIMRARVSPAYLLLWGPLAYFFPVITALIIYLFGGRKHSSLADAKKEVNRVAWRLSEEPNFGGNNFRLLGDRHGRDTLEALRTQIRSAQKRIYISTYILSNDAVGREIVSLLTARAKAGIEVRLLVDAIGSWGIPLTLCRPLQRAGGQIARFNPALPMRGKGSANWRNHRKIAVFDGTAAIIGGQNLGLKYMGESPSNRRFRDCSFSIEGPTAASIERIFIADWCQATDEPPMNFATQLRERPHPVGHARVATIASGPDCEQDPLWDAYVQLFSNCKRSITIVTPYFVPDRVLFSLLVTAAQAGRHVKIMVPRRSDHRLLDLARRWYLRTLRDAGADILFFKPDVLHAKIVIVDDAHLVVGSANLDMRSLFLNYEIGAVVRDPEAIETVNALIDSWEVESSHYSEDLYRQSRTRLGRTVEIISKVLAPWL